MLCNLCLTGTFAFNWYQFMTLKTIKTSPGTSMVDILYSSMGHLDQAVSYLGV